jgi:hypothetical protein
MSLPQPEWLAVANMTPPSKWDDLADRISLVEHGIEALAEQLHHTLNRIQQLPAVAEDDNMMWHTENVRTAVDRLPEQVQRLDDLLGELFTEFGPKVKNSFGGRFVQWREGPWPKLVPNTTFD